MECQTNTQSTPDAKGLLETITLVSQTHVKSLRHGIYDHEDCAKTISDWARSQLCPRWETGVMPLGKGEIHGFSQTDFEVGSQEVSYWHKADISRVSKDVRLWGLSGHRVKALPCPPLTQSGHWPRCDKGHSAKAAV